MCTENDVTVAVSKALLKSVVMDPGLLLVAFQTIIEAHHIKFKTIHFCFAKNNKT